MSRLFDERRKQLKIFKDARSRIQKRPPQGSEPLRYVDCPACGRSILEDDARENLYVCSFCQAYLSMPANERIRQLLDEKSFKEMNRNLMTGNPLRFPGYTNKVFAAQEKSGLKDALLTGVGTIQGEKVALAVMDNLFMMGSMGAVVGERITTLTEYATRKKLPLIIVTTSGGARMQEGMIALMQMTKTSQAIGRHNASGLFYLCLMSHPTTGGVTASFATLADVILAEPRALIGFAGPRVIADTVQETLPEDFQRAEFQLAQGQIDGIVEREHQAEEIAWLVRFHGKGKGK